MRKMIYALILLMVCQVWSQTLELIPINADKKVLVPTADIGDAWRTDIAFDDSDWMVCEGDFGGIGYERNSDYNQIITLDLEQYMYKNAESPNTSCYVRTHFNMDSSLISKLESLTLSMAYDDGFVAYLNGEKVAGANAPDSVKWNSAATRTYQPQNFINFDIFAHKNLLKDGDNLFTVQGLNSSTSNSHFLIMFQLSTFFPVKLASSNLPIMIIDTHGGIIKDAVRIRADMGIIFNGTGIRNNIEDPWNDYNGKISIEYRGVTSQSMFPKKPYRIELNDYYGNDLNASLLGLPEENDFVLHNPYSDKTLIRNVLAYKISNDLGRYASRTRLCELVLNDQYQGVYVLMEKLKRDKNRVDIKKMDSSDVAGDEVTGGYIIKIDKTAGEQVGGWLSKNKVRYQYHYPKPSDIVDAQKTYIQNFMNEFEDVVKSDYYADPDSGYQKYIDLDAFVDFFIVNEISRNIDGYRLSTYMYKDRGGKLNMGPAWDFNLSFGNGNYYNGWETEGWNLDYLSTQIPSNDFQPPFWWKKIRDDHEFSIRLCNRWKALRNDELNTDSLLTFIDAMADTLQEAQTRNFTQWETLGWYVWPNWFVGETYQEEIDFMKTWLEDRIEWIDQEIEAMYLSGVATPDYQNSPEAYSLSQNYPNPFNPTTEIRFSVPKSEIARIEVFDVLGKHVRTLLDEWVPAGSHLVYFNADRLSSGVYYYRITAGNFQKVKKMVLMK